MKNLLYVIIASLDGYVADDRGRFDWAEPDDEVHAFINDLMRPVGTYLYGRLMYETMIAWEAIVAEPGSISGDFATIWRAARKIVFSSTLSGTSSANTTIEREFSAKAIRQMKAEATQDLAIGGPKLAARAFKAGIVDECHVFVAPTIVGGGNEAFPGRVRLDLQLVEQRRFRNGFAYLHYQL